VKFFRSVEGLNMANRLTGVWLKVFYAGFRPRATRHFCFGKSAQNHVCPCAALRVPPPPSRIKMARELAPLKQPRQRGRFGTEAPPRPTQEPKGRIDGSNEGDGLIGRWPSNCCSSSPTSFIGDPGFLSVMATLGRNPCLDQSERSLSVKISCEVP